MQIILTQDVKGKGKKGTVIKVKDGYGMNYLVKNSLGVPANEENMHKLKLDNNKKEREENLRIEEAKKDKEKIEKLVLSFKVNTGKNDQVFGTISTKQIASSLEQKGIKNIKAEIDFPLLRETKKIILEDEDREVLKNVVISIENIVEQDKPPKTINSKICKKCSYFDLCYV